MNLEMKMGPISVQGNCESGSRGRRKEQQHVIKVAEDV
jgi:hypothetical protein